MLVLQLHFDVRRLGLILLPLADLVLGRQRPVPFHDVREAGLAIFAKGEVRDSDAALNQPDVAHLGSYRCA